MNEQLIYMQPLCLINIFAPLISMQGTIKEKIKLTVIVPEIRKSVAEILNKPKSALTGHPVINERSLAVQKFPRGISVHQGWKAEQKILALWAADCAEHVLPYFEMKHPKDERPRKAIDACRNWIATGVFKMSDVRKASLGAHAAARGAKEEDKDAIAAARSAGHAMATAHVPTHAFGAAAYAIKAAALHSNNVDDSLIKERDWQIKNLQKIVNAFSEK